MKKYLVFIALAIMATVSNVNAQNWTDEIDICDIVFNKIVDIDTISAKNGDTIAMAVSYTHRNYGNIGLYVYKLLISENAGKSWKIVGDLENKPNTIAFYNDTCYIGCNGRYDRCCNLMMYTPEKKLEIYPLNKRDIDIMGLAFKDDRIFAYSRFGQKYIIYGHDCIHIN